jgi:hypothetical protein
MFDYIRDQITGGCRRGMPLSALPLRAESDARAERDMRATVARLEMAQRVYDNKESTK